MAFSLDWPRTNENYIKKSQQIMTVPQGSPDMVNDSDQTYHGEQQDHIAVHVFLLWKGGAAGSHVSGDQSRMQMGVFLVVLSGQIPLFAIGGQFGITCLNLVEGSNFPTQWLPAADTQHSKNFTNAAIKTKSIDVGTVCVNAFRAVQRLSRSLPTVSVGEGSLLQMHLTLAKGPPGHKALHKPPFQHWQSKKEPVCLGIPSAEVGPRYSGA
ncbi:hypothetical protein Anapl_09097 [Anas platyrhynchos]|uniref:Uncharacterized protein n=1 Tax=Anas platyrhynchos TaxID=8839 RepID=R0JFJ9_ANAPL|nr:hypothetical protein Anapl_09097 [Anas platyrhynchos]